MEFDFDACYQAITARDRRFDGVFVTAVRTTGIYCRPICPSRTPLRRNVEFFPHPAAAESAGYRSCRRCHPEAMPGSRLWDSGADLVARALELIDEGVVDDAGVSGLAARLHVSERHLHRLFADTLGAGPLAVARTRRVQLALRLLDETALPITDVAFTAGFGSVRQFNATLRAARGSTPTQLRAGRRRDSGPLTLRLAARPPYDASAVLGWLADRTIAGVEEVRDGCFRRVHGDAVVELRPHEHGALLTVHGATPARLAALVARSRRLLDLDAHPAAIGDALSADPALAPLVSARPGLRVTGTWEPFELAVRAVVGQQVSVSAGRTLLGRLVRRAGEPLARPEGALTHRFPTPAALAAADLTALGLTGRRAATLRDLATAVADGSLVLDGGRADTRAALLALPGVGSWTADYVALHSGDPDAFPVGDLVLRRAAAVAGLPPDARGLLERAERWRPWRGYAAQHLWASMSAPGVSAQVLEERAS